MPTSAEIQAALTGPGGPFEVVTETVRGVPMKVYKARMTSLREVSGLGATRGDAETHIVYGDRRYSFGELARLANSVSHTLAGRFGLRPGDRLAVLSANNPEWVLAFWGTVDMGAVLVGLNGWWKTDEILYGLADSGSRILVADRDRFARISGQLGDCPDLEAVFLIDADPSEVGSDPRLHRFDELLESPTDQAPDQPIDEDEPAVIFYTSGTTGRPKGAVSTHRSMIANLQNTMFNAVAGMMTSAADPGASAAPAAPDAPAPAGPDAPAPAGPDAPAPAAPAAPEQAASLLTSPLFHVSGCHSGIVVGMLAGIKLVMPVGRFDPEKAMSLIQDERITIWATVPTMVWRVVDHPDRGGYDLSSVTSVAYGGSPSAAELQRRVRETFPSVRTLGNAYGLTESSSVATLNSGQDMVDRPDSVGRPLPVVEIRIVGADATDQPPGSVGEVWIKGPIIMPGYWNKPEATAESVTDGWLHSGDIGYLDADGYLYITDRAKDMIIRGGENIYCVEIENRLVEHPAVAEAAVIGVPHPSLGEEVKAVVRLEPGASLDAAGVRSWVAEALADFKVPAHVDFTDDLLPRNASGKLLKNVLRGEGEVSFAETM